METIGIVLAVLGIAGTIIFGLRSKKVADAFSRYIQIEEEINLLKIDSVRYKQKIFELEKVKSDVYRHKYIPKSKPFIPGDKVRLVKIPRSRSWITDHSKIGMTGIVVDYGPGQYEFQVYWSQLDYEGRPIDDISNRWQSFWVNKDEIKRIG